MRDLPGTVAEANRLLRDRAEETGMAEDERARTVGWLRERAEVHRTGHPVVRDEQAARDCDEMADLAERRCGR